MDPRMAMKASVDRLIKQVQAERNPMHGLMAAVGGSSYQHHKLTDILFVILDDEAREMLKDRLAEMPRSEDE